LFEAAREVQAGSYDLGICDGDEDFLKFRVEVGQRVVATIEFDDIQADLDMELLDEDDFPVDSSRSVTSSEEVTATVTGPGFLTLRVWAYGGTDEAPYRLTLSLQGGVGAPCATEADCNGGNLDALCVPEVSAEDGEDTGFVDGYCTAIECTADRQCGTGNWCVRIAEDGSTACFKGCTTRANCRAEYACAELSDGAGGICVPACASDADCTAPATCDVATGICAPP
jgi:hypothetical protein